MSAHTPGPWSINCKDITTIGGFRVNRIAISGNGMAIASVWAGDPQKQRFALLEHEGHANARLIAAAPDMAAALQGLIDMVDQWAPKLSVGPEMTAAHVALVRAGVE